MEERKRLSIDWDKWKAYHISTWRWRPTSTWRLTLNLILQPQTNAKVWMEHHKSYNGVTFFEFFRDDSLNKKMEEICIQISSGYCARYEEESSKIIPMLVKHVIGTSYLFEQPSTFRLPLPFSQFECEWQIVQLQCEDINSLSESVSNVLESDLETID